MLKQEKIGHMLNDIDMIEPKRTNRWLVRFPENFDIPMWSISSVTSPKTNMHIWEPITIRIRDFVRDNPVGTPAKKPTVPEALLDMVSKYKNQGPGFFNFSNKPLFDISIELLDGTGVIIENWSIEVEKIVSVDFGGTLDYAIDDIKTCTLVLQPKNCSLLSKQKSFFC